MKWFLRIFAASCLSIGLALALSFIPAWHSNAVKDQQALPVQSNIQLTNGNLVDYLVELPILLNYDRVNWEHQTLYLDLLINDTLYSKQQIQHDLYEICYFGLVEVNNIRNIRVRVMLKEPHVKQSKLVMAMDAKPSAEAVEQLKNSRKSGGAPPVFLQAYTNLTYTNLWKNLNPS